MQPFQRVKNEILATEELLGQRLPILRQQYNEAKSSFYQPDLSGGGSVEGGAQSWKEYLYEKGSEAAKYGKDTASSYRDWGAKKAADMYAAITVENAEKGALQIKRLADALIKSGKKTGKVAARNFTKAACEICDSPGSLAKKDLNKILYMVKGLYSQLAIIVSNFEHLQSELEKAEEDPTLLSLEDIKPELVANVD